MTERGFAHFSNDFFDEFEDLFVTTRKNSETYWKERKKIRRSQNPANITFLLISRSSGL